MDSTSAQNFMALSLLIFNWTERIYLRPLMQNDPISEPYCLLICNWTQRTFLGPLTGNDKTNIFHMISCRRF